ncbi:hypothetical protein [Streptomyces sp. NBC_01320]|uniref:hypothetical protein n=1 Tax=Streptomyces sp. NBC_01320 TaxID=2903824 RepID=UPI002E0F02E5|nr:hypothetical protein OG395_44265 [Streptomyces sp. NBC_01320]
MSDDISDTTENVVGVLTAQIEAHFGVRMDQLKAAVSVARTANPDATDVVKWHRLLADSQAELDRAEDALLAALETQPSEVDNPTLGLAHRVNAAVAARDGRALVVRWLLDTDAPGRRDLAAERLARLSRAGRKGPAVQTSPPH